MSLLCDFFTLRFLYFVEEMKKVLILVDSLSGVRDYDEPGRTFHISLFNFLLFHFLLIGVRDYDEPGRTFHRPCFVASPLFSSLLALSRTFKFAPTNQETLENLISRRYAMRSALREIPKLIMNKYLLGLKIGHVSCIFRVCLLVKLLLVCLLNFLSRVLRRGGGKLGYQEPGRTLPNFFHSDQN